MILLDIEISVDELDPIEFLTLAIPSINVTFKMKKLLFENGKMRKLSYYQFYLLGKFLKMTAASFSAIFVLV